MTSLEDVFKGALEVEGPLVYRIYNKINRKSYIGQTKISLSNRFITSGRSHLIRYLDGYNSDLYSEMKMFGLNNFEVEILYRGEELDKYEEMFIKEFNSELEGYNLTSGGKSFSKHAQIKGAKILSEICRSENKGSFFNEEEHRKAASKGGKIVRITQVQKVLDELSSRGLEINRENYSAIRLEISNRTCPNFDLYLNKYQYLTVQRLSKE